MYIVVKVYLVDFLYIKSWAGTWHVDKSTWAFLSTLILLDPTSSWYSWKMIKLEAVYYRMPSTRFFFTVLPPRPCYRPPLRCDRTRVCARIWRRIEGESASQVIFSLSLKLILFDRYQRMVAKTWPETHWSLSWWPYQNTPELIYMIVRSSTHRIRPSTGAVPIPKLQTDDASTT